MVNKKGHKHIFGHGTREKRDVKLSGLLKNIVLISILILILGVIIKLNEPNHWVAFEYIFVCLVLLPSRLIIPKLSKYVDFTLFVLSDLALLYLLIVVSLKGSISIANIFSGIVSLSMITYLSTKHILARLDKLT
jgi:hypothetical protein